MEDDEIKDGDDNNTSNSSPSSENEDVKPFTFTQQATVELSQSLPAVKDSERLKLQSLNPTAISSATSDLARLILFKALSKEPIDRLKCINEALKDVKDQRVSNAIFEQAAKRLSDVFGFDIRSVPDFMKDNLGSKFKDRYYVINKVIDCDGTHSRYLHDNEESSVKGVLMVVLAFSFSKGNPSRQKGSRLMRWITESQLYHLLHKVDDSIPEEPPSKRERRKSGLTTMQELDIDLLLEKFVRTEYLLKEKLLEGGTEEGGGSVMYAMGPRAALEIGRRQLVYFCAQVMDEEPDPTILADIDDENDVSDSEGKEN